MRDTARHCYLVTYDITSDRRLRKVFKLMRGFGDHLQYSVFMCELSAKELARLRERLAKEISHADDQVLVVNLGPASDQAQARGASLGRPYTHVERHCLIV